MIQGRLLPRPACGISSRAALTLALCLVAAPWLYAQSGLREYIHLGGRVIAIENSVLTITTQSPLPDGTAGDTYSPSPGLTASGGTPPYSWTLTSPPNSLPSGLSLAQTGSFSGTISASATGTYNFKVSVKDSSGVPLTATSGTLSITVVSGLAITTGSPLPSGDVGAAYSTTLAARGGIMPFTWSASGLPAGLSINSSTGVISGSPTTAATYNPNIGLKDSSNPPQTTSKTLTVTINGSLTIATTPLPTGLAGGAYPGTLTASGGAAPYTWTLTGGSPPPNLSLASNGSFTGTITTAAAGISYSFTATVTDSTGQSKNRSFVLQVVAPLTMVPTGGATSSSAVPHGTFPLGYSNIVPGFQATGGTYPFHWTSSGLPSWLNLSSSGSLSIPSQVSLPTGQLPAFSITVTDSSNPPLSLTEWFYVAVTSGSISIGSLQPTGVYAGQSITINAWNNANGGQSVNADWSRAGAGTLSQPTTGVSSITYTAPSAVFPNQTDLVSANVPALLASQSLGLFMLPPSAAVTPSGGNVTAGQAVVFTMSGSQGDNWNSPNDYFYVDFDASGTYQYNNTCYVWYQPYTKTVYLASDNANNSPASGALGSSHVLSNSQCSVNLSSGTAALNGPILTLTLPVTFSAGYPGRLTIFAQDYPDTDALYFTVGSVNVIAPAPTISSLSPTTGAAGAAVTISGSNFGNHQWASTVTFNGTQATATSWSVNSIAVTVPGAATSGNVVVTVGGVASNGVNFTVIPTPVITSLSPISGPIGIPVTIAGSNFGSSQGASTVTFNGTAASVSSWSATSIGVTVPSGATTGNVVVTVGGIPSKGVNFSVSPTSIQMYSSAGTYTWTVPAGVTSVKAECWGPGGNGGNGEYLANQSGYYAWTSGGGGGGGAYARRNTVSVSPGAQYQIVIGGHGSTTQTSFGASICAADYGQTGQNGYFAGQFNAGAGGPGGQLSNSLGDVTVGGGSGGTGGNPYGGGGGGAAGANAGIGAGAAGAYGGGNGGNGAECCYVLPTAGGAPGGGGGGGAGNSGYNTGSSGADGRVALTYTPSVPAISSLSPTIGAVGTAVTVTGANFGSSQGTSTVTFNGTSAGAATTWSPTSITVHVPSGATTGNVVVTMGGAVSNGVSFTVIPAPSVTSLAPNTGPVGASVTITGTNFGSSQGGSTVMFNGTPAVAGSWSATSIVVTVPSGATTGNVVVTVDGVASNGVAFTRI